MVGFDLVGQEDLGRPLKDFAKRLLELPESLNFYFHAAETNWFGVDTDRNIVSDCIIINFNCINIVMTFNI